MFSGSSTGDIRYSDRHSVSCDSGKLITKYKVKARGWFKAKVNVPPNKFLWICPRNGAGEIDRAGGTKAPLFWMVRFDPAKGGHWRFRGP
jgi:hypothetical protein